MPSDFRRKYVADMFDLSFHGHKHIEVEIHDVAKLLERAEELEAINQAYLDMKEDFEKLKKFQEQWHEDMFGKEKQYGKSTN